MTKARTAQEFFWGVGPPVSSQKQAEPSCPAVTEDWLWAWDFLSLSQGRRLCLYLRSQGAVASRLGETAADLPMWFAQPLGRTYRLGAGQTGGPASLALCCFKPQGAPSLILSEGLPTSPPPHLLQAIPIQLPVSAS